MSTKCCYRVEGKTTEYKDPVTGKVTKNTRLRPCGKDIRAFLRVDYSELHPYRQRESKFYDIFGFCTEHADTLVAGGIPAWGYKESNYGRWDTVRGIRGLIKFVSRVPASEIPDPKELAKREDKLRLMAAVKSDLKRIMNQRNTEKLTLDDWRAIFDETVDEFVVEGVMLS